MRNTYSGVAAAVGVLANKLAVCGFTGSRGAQQTAFGDLVGELVDPTALTELDPDRLLIAEGYVKVHSSCALSHTVIDAALALGRLPVDEIDQIEIETTTRNLRLSGQAAPNSLSTRFSLPYAAATAIVHGHAGPDAFEPDERVFALAKRVEVRNAIEFDEAWPSCCPARVTAYVHGQERTALVQNPIGYPGTSLTRDDLRTKFETLTELSNHPVRHYDYDRLLDVAGVADVAGLFQS